MVAWNLQQLHLMDGMCLRLKERLHDCPFAFASFFLTLYLYLPYFHPILQRYMATEIGARNFADKDRYGMLKVGFSISNLGLHRLF